MRLVFQTSNRWIYFLSMAPMTCKHDEGVSGRPRWHLHMCCSVADLSSRSVVSPLGIYSRKVGDSNNDVIVFFFYFQEQYLSRGIVKCWPRTDVCQETPCLHRVQPLNATQEL